jgi:hypothetical protein
MMLLGLKLQGCGDYFYKPLVHWNTELAPDNHPELPHTG